MSCWRSRTASPPSIRICGTTAVITTPMDEKIALALELERATRGADPRVRQVSSADYSDARVEVALASTTGIRSSTRRTTAFISVDAIAGEGADSQTGTGFSVGRSPAALDPDEAMADAVLRSTRLLGAQKAKSGRCTVVFDPRVVSTLLSVVASALSGEAVVKGRSFFAGRIGESVAGAGVTLIDDPTDGRAFSAASYDGEGLACRRNVLISDGMLQMFVYDTVSARRAQTRSTGSAVRGGFAGTPSAGCRAVVLSPGTKSAEEILAAGRRGALRPVGHRHPLGGQHGERATSRSVPRACSSAVASWPNLCARSPWPRPCNGCCIPWWRSAATCAGSPAWRPVRRWPSPTCSSAGTEVGCWEGL